MDYRNLLRDELKARRLKNGAYSARAFSRDLGISAGFLSQVLQGRKALNEERALKIAKRLDWDHDRCTTFAILVRYEITKDEHAKSQIHSELVRGRAQAKFHDIDADSFRVIADWHHYALVELAKTPDFQPDPVWMARKLGLSAPTARASVERLKRLGLIEDVNGAIRPVDNYAAGDVPSSAVRAFHSQMLRKADRALREQAFEARNFSGITMAIDPTRVAEAKNMVRRFRRELMTFLEGGEQTAIYHVAVQLFRLDKENIT